MIIHKPEWYIEGWLCEPGRQSGCCFSLVTTEIFEEMSLRAIQKASVVKLQQLAGEIIQKAGTNSFAETFLFNKEERLIQINIPSTQSGCWLARDSGKASFGHWSGHNIDTPLQQSLLYTLWHLWASMVEALGQTDADNA